MERGGRIAIVGLGGVFPGAADLSTFWHNIITKQDASAPVPSHRWVMPPASALASEVQPDRVYSLRACLIDNQPLDPTGLNIDPHLLTQLDPLYHLVLSAGRAAFLDGVTGRLDRRRVGVILGAIALPTDGASAITREVLGPAYAKAFSDSRAAEEGTKGEFPGTHPLNARPVGLPAALLAKALSLGGGTYTLDAACASSLYAVKLACDELLSGRTDAMLAGGVSRPDCLYTQMGFSQLRALSPSGRCAPFDENCDGLVVGEGAGIVLLKRLEDAQRDGDRIYGVIQGIGLSNDIAGSLLAPDCEGQLRAMRQAYEAAGWKPTDVDLIECHGTGTPLGDAVEIRSLRTLWGKDGWQVGQCPIGSVKSNIGHLLTGAGAAGLIKVLLALQDKTLPPTANYHRPCSDVPLAGGPFRVQTETSPWISRDSQRPRRAAINAFGFGGINAHILVEECPQPTTTQARGLSLPHVIDAGDSPHHQQSPIAIVGMATHFGNVPTLRHFQELVLRGETAIKTRPRDRWYGVDENARTRLSGRSLPGAYLDQLSLPLGRFRLPPNEIPEVLPQQLLMLETAANALADAGLATDCANPRASTIIGMALDMATTDCHLRWWQPGGTDAPDAAPVLNATRTIGALGNIIASRIAREFRFGGPSYAISSDEVSGLRAVDIAAQALRRGELDIALVGAVDLAGDVRNILATHALRPFSTQGEARPYDASAEGAALGEGAAALVLKRLDDAERNGDRIYAVIRGLGFASGGGIDNVAPDVRTYETTLQRAYQEAACRPHHVAYIEGQGSGDPREDSVEITALVNALGERDWPAALGSVKANIGHTGAAAGLASLIKTAICLYQEILPPLRGFEHTNNQAESLADRLHLPRDAQYWARNQAEGPRRAGISAFTLDGNFAHAVLEGRETSKAATDSSASRQTIELRDPLGARRPVLLVVEGDTPLSLREGLDLLEKQAAAQNDIDHLARQWYARRGISLNTSQRQLAVAFTVSNHHELTAQLALAQRSLRDAPESPLDGREGVFYTPTPLAPEGQLAFVFPGSGNHFVGMGRQLGLAWPEILRELDSQTGHLASQMLPRSFIPWRTSWLPGWEREAEGAVLDDAQRLIFGQLSFGLLVNDLLQAVGVHPRAVIGYSLGESVSLFATRAWSSPEEMWRRMTASTLFNRDLSGHCDAVRRSWKIPDQESVDWLVVVVRRTAEEVRKALEHVPHARLLIVNTPDECVVGGLRRDVESVVMMLGCKAVRVDGVPTVHCDVVQAVEEAYRELHLLPTLPPPGIRFYSAVWGHAYEVGRQSAAVSIAGQALMGFDFPSLIKRAYDDGVRLFVEIGPQGSCSRMIGKILAGRPHFARSASIRGEDEVAGLMRLLAALAAERVSLDWSALYGRETPAIELPNFIKPLAKGQTIVVAIGRPPFQFPRSDQRSDLSLPSKGSADVVQDTKHAPYPGKARLPASSPHSHPGVNQPSNNRGRLIQEVTRTTEATASAHDTYLKSAQNALTGISAILQRQRQLIASAAIPSHGVQTLPKADTTSISIGAGSIQPAPITPVSSPIALNKAPREIPAFTRDLCLEFARGLVSKVLGPDYAEADTYPIRVRLPDEPLMFVDRIMQIEGTKGSLSSGRIVTEHDVLAGAWYLDGGRCPPSLTIEAGQADLFLCSYLGIDFAVRGTRVYRLLDATVTFHRELPRPGETIRYDIVIDRFVRQGETHLFFFRFDGSINGAPVLSMRNGCAGFFTTEEIENSGGIILTDEENSPPPPSASDHWQHPVPMAEESYDDRAIKALQHGDLGTCFGGPFAAVTLPDPPRLPGNRMQLIHRVPRITPRGGRYGRGFITTETDIYPQDWFLTCHFVDDQTMPGTLMYESCLHTLRIFLLRMGWVGNHSEVAYQPVPGVASQLRCRGPVSPHTRKMSCQVDIKELGYRPEPYAIADALIFADGKKIVLIKDMSLRITGLDSEKIEALWREPSFQRSSPLVFDKDHLLSFCRGNPSEAFGDPYRPFDNDRKIARLPSPPYLLIDRVTRVTGKPWKLQAGIEAEAEFDVLPDAWYFRANRQTSMPLCILLEVGLQSCGWLAAYLGSALRSTTDLSFRNLDGQGKQLGEVFPDTGTLHTRVRLLDFSEAGGMILEKFHLQIYSRDRIIYEGHTSFGFFSAESLAQQVGLRDALARRYQPSANDLLAARSITFANEHPLTPEDPNGTVPGGLHLPARSLRMVDAVTHLIPNGGPKGLGFIKGEARVDPSAWFFQAHFFQDPVWPGSLGLESFIQLLKAEALDRWGNELGATYRFEPIALGLEHHWKYRGQILPSCRRVEVEAIVTRREDGPAPLLVADGFLIVDGVPIYEMKNFGIRLIR